MKTKLHYIFILGALSFISGVVKCQSPNLGTAANFAVFTTTGALDNLGATIIQGDIGTNTGSFSGFPPGTLYGTSHVSDATTAQATTDLNVAYNFLLAQTCDTTIGVSLGSGQILTPRVYCIGAASTLTGDLILDGLGNPNSVFIIKIDGTLSASGSSRVLLTDSASWCNVYWQINGAFSLGNNSLFRGTAISNGTISLLQSSDVIGRALSISGAIDLHNNTVTNDCASLVPLPVELLSFNALCKNEKILINWSTASEINLDFFTLESSSDGKNWQEQKVVKGSGNSDIPVQYSVSIANSITPVNYFRLKETDFNGQFKYSGFIAFSNCTGNGENIILYPNPTSGLLQISMPGIGNTIGSVSAYNATGRMVYYQNSLTQIIDLSIVPAGIYVISFQTETQIIQRKIILIK